MAEVCSESSFQPILLIFSNLPCLILNYETNSVGSGLKYFLTNSSLRSVVFSILSIIWAFASYTQTKNFNAMSKLSKEFILILVQTGFNSIKQFSFVTYSWTM